MRRWLAMMMVAVPTLAQAEEPAPPPDVPNMVTPTGQPRPLERDYCVNFSEAAAEARVARQQAELSALRDAVAEKISELNLRTAILKQWVERREALLNAAGDELVKIYGTLEPDVAAQQIVRLDVRVATSILRKLKPAAAGAILNAMEPKRAALLAKVISSAGAGP
jgi:flagellar motility protein MotE (MotC chaperone)